MKAERPSWSGAAGATAPVDEAAYERVYPYYAELCALSELAKNPGFGAKVQSGIGGHCLLYLSGVRRDRSAGYPLLELCPPDAAPARHGVGISVNSHYRNANWVAADGPEFLWRGALRPGEGLTRESYARTQHQAKERGTLDGVQFHEKLFRDKPPGMSERDYMYEISVATDYAALFGRDVTRARVPLDRPRMAAIVAYLNALNAPYRAGGRDFIWRLFNDNCAHVTHNALAAAGVWAPWPTGQFFALAAFRFPVPKNEFVDLMRRTNDLPIGDARAMYEDLAARRLLLESATLPTGPGALAFATPAIRPNDLYRTEKLRLIFFDNPFWGRYRFRFAKIFREPRYVDLAANLLHYAELYEAILQRNTAAPGQAGASTERASFEVVYDRMIAREAVRLRRQLASLERQPQREAVVS